MLLAAIADLLPAAMAIALSPFPLVAAALALGGPEGTCRGAAFAAGWVLGLGLLTALLAFAVGEIDALAVAPGPWLRILLGLALLAVAVRKWRTRPTGDDPVLPPGWMASLDRGGRARVFGIGAALGGANPKNLALAAAGAASIAYHLPPGWQAGVAVLAFVALGSSSVLGAVLASAAGGPGAAAAIDRAKQFMLRNNNVILMVVFALIGVKVVGDGLAALAG